MVLQSNPMALSCVPKFYQNLKIRIECQNVSRPASKDTAVCHRRPEPSAEGSLTQNKIPFCFSFEGYFVPKFVLRVCWTSILKKITSVEIEVGG